jgi:hypothetical protein
VSFLASSQHKGDTWVEKGSAIREPVMKKLAQPRELSAGWHLAMAVPKPLGFGTVLLSSSYSFHQVASRKFAILKG